MLCIKCVHLIVLMVFGHESLNAETSSNMSIIFAAFFPTRNIYLFMHISLHWNTSKCLGGKVARRLSHNSELYRSTNLRRVSCKCENVWFAKLRKVSNSFCFVQTFYAFPFFNSINVFTSLKHRKGMSGSRKTC